MSYTVQVTREGADWLADVPSVAGAHTFARSLAALEKSVREVIILMDDLTDDAELELEWDYQLSDSILTDALAIAERRATMAFWEAAIQADTLKSARALTESGFSTRDTARLLGVTAGRVSQIVNS